MSNIPKTPYHNNWLSKQQKKNLIEFHFSKILNVLGMDLSNDSIKETPKRVAKMYIDEIFSGLDEDKFPKITVQENKFKYDQMLIETGITVKSVCEHHIQPIIGHAHIAYIPDDKVIGLSKLNRVTEFYSRRPQVQERLTQQIKTTLQNVLKTDNVAVVIDAIHFCVKMRGVEHEDCTTRTSALAGEFRKSQALRTEFFNSIPRLKV